MSPGSMVLISLRIMLDIRRLICYTMPYDRIGHWRAEGLTSETSMTEYEIILVQSIHIRELEEAFDELVSVIAWQYNQLHKPKRTRSKRSATTPAQ